MGILDHILDNWDVDKPWRKKRKLMQTVEIKVKMDCEGCVRKVRKAVSNMKGAKEVEVDRKESKVTVTGYVDPDKVLNKIKATGKISADFWPYIPYDLVYYPYAPGAYDKKAPPGYVKDVPQALPYPATPNSEAQLKYTWMFSDENPTAPCSIM